MSLPGSAPGLRRLSTSSFAKLQLRQQTMKLLEVFIVVLPNQPAKPKLIAFLWKGRIQRPGLQPAIQPWHVQKNGENWEEAVVDLDVFIHVLVPGQKSNWVTVSQFTDNIESKVLRLVGELNWLELCRCREILLFNERDELGHLIVNTWFESLALFTRKLEAQLVQQSITEQSPPRVGTHSRRNLGLQFLPQRVIAHGEETVLVGKNARGLIPRPLGELGADTGEPAIGVRVAEHDLIGANADEWAWPRLGYLLHAELAENRAAAYHISHRDP